MPSSVICFARVMTVRDIFAEGILNLPDEYASEGRRRKLENHICHRRHTNFLDRIYNLDNAHNCIASAKINLLDYYTYLEYKIQYNGIYFRKEILEGINSKSQIGCDFTGVMIFS